MVVPFAFARFSEGSRTAKGFARLEAARRSEPSTRTEHLVLGVASLSADPSAQALAAAGADVGRLSSALAPVNDPEASLHAAFTHPLADDLRDTAVRANRHASRLEQPWVAPGHLILAVLDERALPAGRLLAAAGVDAAALQAAVERVLRDLPDPPVVDDLLERIEKNPPLSAVRLEELGAQVVAWRSAKRTLHAGGDRVTAAEREAAAQTLEQTRTAWLTLLTHSDDLVLDAVHHFSAEGHRPAYIQAIARQAVGTSSMSFDPDQHMEFRAYASAEIARALEERFNRGGSDPDA